MKRISFLSLWILFSSGLFAQADSTGTEKADTIRIGRTIIIRKHRNAGGMDGKECPSCRKRNSRMRTSWWVVDIGFNNYYDQTNYAAVQGFVAPGIQKDQLELRAGKSINVNIWLFLQRLALVRKVVFLKYGLGLEMNNYRYGNKSVVFQRNPTFISLNPQFSDAQKNKLAAHYITVPLMLHFNFTPGLKQGFGLSAGLSAGYLAGAHQKIKLHDEKTKLHDDFNLRRWKLSYAAELNLGPASVYGTYAWKSMWEKALDQTPYSIGLRFSHP